MNSLSFIFFKNELQPVRLAKQPTKEDHMRSLNCWIARNYYIVALTVIVIALLMFVITCFCIIGTSSVESGNYYYHMI